MQGPPLSSRTASPRSSLSASVSCIVHDRAWTNKLPTAQSHTLQWDDFWQCRACG